MAVTYYKPFPAITSYKVPKLYRVDYGETADGVREIYQVGSLDYQVYQWVKENCKGRYYRSPEWVWANKKYFQFEDEQDAVLFALRWS